MKGMNPKGGEGSQSIIDPAHLRLREMYEETARKYRAQDEEHLGGADYRHLSRVLTDLSSSFRREINVLDLGCGTGRYFHCISNAKQLVGLDISPEMLEAARSPVRSDLITAREIVLFEGDLFSARFSAGSFDMIYCLGVFGNGCEISTKACAKIYDWLTPSGMWLFDAMDVSELRSLFRIRKILAARVYSLLPIRFKALWIKRSGWPPFFGANSNQVRATLLKSGFSVEWITSRRSRLPGGPGFKLEVLCRKPT